MLVFAISVVLVLTVSAFCSLSEAALYAVRLPYVRVLAESGRGAGKVLLQFKQNMQRPIAAILILNTIANTAGATIAGAQARSLFGEGAVTIFAVLFTLSVLLLSEILPKVIGVTYNRVIAPGVSIPLRGALLALAPLVWLTDAVTRLVSGAKPQPIATEDEVEQFAQMSAEEGSILPEEAELVRNVLQLNEVRAKQILTPRTVVYKLPKGQTVEQLRNTAGSLPYSRIPVYDDDDPEHWIGVVIRRDILARLASGKTNVTVGSLAKPLHFVPGNMLGHKLLREFLARRAHLFGVLDEFGSVAGVVTLEDILESLIGEEIVDETDTAVDLQETARQRGGRLLTDEHLDTDSRD
jgi:magnesium and cobalt exporter, CNNM family